jgi:O-antigen ligase
MSVASLARDVAAIASAAGCAALLVRSAQGPMPRTRRAAGLVLLLAGWVALAVTLVPGQTRHDLHRVFSRPVTAVAAVVALAVAVAVFVLLVRLTLRRPVVWFVLLAVALPIRVPVTVGGREANLLVPLYALILVGLGAWIWGRLRGTLVEEGERGTPLDLPLAAFVAYLLVSTLWSSDGAQAAIAAVAFYIPFVLLYRLVVAWWPRARALRALVTTTLVMALPVSLFAIAQYLTRRVFWNHRLEQSNVYSRFFRVNGIFYDPNILGRYLVLALLVTVGIALLRPANRRALLALGGLSVVYLAGLAVTFSRSSALALMVGLVLIALKAFGWRRTLAVGGVLVVVMGTAAALKSHNVRRAFTSSARFQRVSEGRFALVKGGLEIWRDDPVVGTGLGSFEHQYQERLTRRERARTRVIISHNAPVTVLTELGSVGFALFLVLLGWTAFAIGRAGRAPGAEGMAEWVMLALLAAIFVHSLLYSALFEDPYTWAVAGAAIALAGRRAADTPAPASRPSEPVPVA